MLFRHCCFVLIVASVSSCYRDTRTHPCAYENPVDLKNECRDVVEYMPGPNNTFRYNKVGLHQYGPSFNPNNSNELAYVLHPNTPQKLDPHLVIYNFETGQHTFIGWLNPIYDEITLDWSAKDFIYVSGNKVIVNPRNRTSASVSKKIVLSGARWSASGDRLLGWHRLNNDSMKRYWDKHYPDYKMAYLTWPEREIVPMPLFKDHPLMVPHVISVSPKNDLLYYDFQEKALYTHNLDNEENNELFSSEVKIGRAGNDYDWSPDGNTLYFANSNDGIFTITKGENRQHRIKKGCPNRQYGQIAISPNGDKLVAQRRDIEAERDGSYISETTHLVIMDINGCNERILFENWDGHVEGRP